MEALGSSETSACLYRTTRRHVKEDSTLHAEKCTDRVLNESLLLMQFLVRGFELRSDALVFHPLAAPFLAHETSRPLNFVECRLELVGQAILLSFGNKDIGCQNSRHTFMSRVCGATDLVSDAVII
jgi:hypothetical protein